MVSSPTVSIINLGSSIYIRNTNTNEKPLSLVAPKNGQSLATALGGTQSLESVATMDRPFGQTLPVAKQVIVNSRQERKT